MAMREFQGLKRSMDWGKESESAEGKEEVL
jgi:hypothetical protein